MSIYINFEAFIYNIDLTTCQSLDYMRRKDPDRLKNELFFEDSLDLFQGL